MIILKAFRTIAERFFLRKRTGIIDVAGLLL